MDGVDLTVRRGTVHALIGPNGSGKTTFINVVTGLYEATAGKIGFLGQDITRFAPHQRNRAGLARTYQNIRVFRGMTVLDNVMIGAERKGNDVAGDAVRRRGSGHWRRSTSWRCAAMRIAWSVTCPTAISVTSRSPARWRAARRCCCSTSREPG